ncbi:MULTISPECIES: restriction endonuclease subunit S [Stutzerimonas]|uniref:Type I restriction enzyme, S subunit n=1 Tax=Stutzerimonas balearica DSM 6083 TaxID=1123016 RepID=A0ABY0QUJ2_9GAMM|nr:MULTISPECIES: restriction endonuclease subunit S [Stutzerimonas]SDL93325.1 type I restriction enzyme, S subunit [Stutzerimonas balearica DSM 6083]
MKNVPLGDIATLVRGVSFSKEEGSLLPLEGHLPVIRAGSIQESLLLREGQIWVPADKIKSSQKIRIDDIVMCTSSGSSDLVGKCARSTEDFDGSFGAFCAGIRADQEKASPSYLYHFLCSPVFKNWTSASSGANIKNIRVSELAEFQVPLPSLPEQKRIAAILDKADAIRRKRQQAIQLADDFLSAQFLQKFGDPKDSPFGSRSLKDVALKVTDGAHFTPTYVDSGIPFLRVTDINRGEVDWSKVKYIPLEEHQELIKRCKPEKGDVLYSKNGTIGVPRLIDWDQEFSIFVSLCLIKPNPNYLRGRYLYSFLQTPFALKQATQKAKSATVTNLHLVEIKEIKLPVPSLAIQDEWIDFVDNFGCMRARLIESLNTSNDAFNSLSQKAFSGML